MSGTLRLRGATSGYAELQAAAVAGDQTFILPAAGGTLLTTDSPIGNLTLELGSASAPSLRFEGDTDTGLFSSGANTLNLVTGGSNKLVLGATAHTIFSGTNGSVRALDIDSSGNIGVGESNPDQRFHVKTSSDDVFKLESTSDGNGPNLTFSHTGASPADNDVAGKLTFTATNDASQETTFADIKIIATDVTDSSEDAAFAFSTRSNGTFAEHLRLDSSGRLLMGSTVAGNADADNINVAGGGNVGITFRGSSSGTGNIFFADSTLGDDLKRGQIVYDHSGNSMRLHTNAVERLRINSSGNIGIGTTSPTETLTLNSAAGASLGFEYGGTEIATINNNNAALYVHAASGKLLSLGAGGSERMRIDSDGRLLIGATTTEIHPTSSRLQLTGTDFAESSILQTRYETGVSGASLLLQHARGTKASPVVLANGDELGKIRFTAYNGTNFQERGAQIKALIDGTFTGTYYPTRLEFETSDGTNSGSNEAMRIDSSGNVGIGTTSPMSDAQLTLGADSEVGLGFARTGAGRFDAGILVSSGHIYFKGGAESGTIASLNHLMIIQSGGNVGIGTTTPTEKLEINSGTGNTPLKLVSNDANVFIHLADNATTSANRIGATGDNIVLYTGNAEKLRIDSSGRVRFQPYGLSLPSSGEMDAPIFVALQGNADPTAAAGSAQTFMLRTMDCGSTGSAYTGYEIRNRQSGDLRLLNQDSGISNRATFYIYQDTDINDLEKTFQISYLAAVYAPGVYDHTTSNGANVNVTSGGQLRRSTSSIRFKTDVETLEDSYADALLNCRPVWYRSTSPSDNPAYSYWGFIAEEVAEIDPRLVQWSTETTAFEDAIDNDGNVIFEEDGVTPQKMRVKTIHDEPQPESVAYERFVPHLLNLIKRQQQTIESLENRIATLENN